MAGDPFLYASGPEEAQACVKAGLGFEIVPGVSSVNAVPAYAGIPLTTKDHREVAVVTCGDKVDWSQYADKRTLVLLSAVGQIGDIAKALVAAGRDAADPGRDDPGRHDDRAGHRHLDPRADRRRRPRRADGAAGRHRRRRRRRPARDAVVVRDQAALRLARPGAAHQGAGRLALRAAARLRRRARRGARPSRSSRRATRSRWTRPSAAWSRVATSGSPSPRSTPSRPCARSSRSTASTPAPSPASRSPPSATRPPRRSATGACAPTWCRPASSPPPACWTTGRSTTRLLDPINRVFLPRADIATENLVAGLIDLGWECDDVTAYRTVRAAPPPAPDPRRDQDRQVRRRRLHLVLDGAQPGRHRRQAAPVDDHRGDRAGDGEDRRGARPAGRRPGRRAGRRGARRRARRLRCRPSRLAGRGRPAGDQAVGAQAVGAGARPARASDASATSAGR